MTTVERLIRRACEEAKARVMAEREEEMRKLPVREVRLDQCGSAHVRDLVKRNYRARMEVDRTNKELDRLGWDAPSSNREPVTVHRDYKAQEKLQAAVTGRQSTRLRKVETLRTETTIACMGLSPIECRDAIRKLQAELVKV